MCKVLQSEEMQRLEVNNGVAIGNATKVASLNGFSLGNTSWAGYDEAGNYVGADNDQAFGTNARAWVDPPWHLVTMLKAAAGGAVAMGNGSQARGKWAVAIGNNAQARGEGVQSSWCKLLCSRTQLHCNGLGK